VTAQQFLDELAGVLAEAQERGLQSVEIEAGWLHARVGGYPGQDHRMPACCNAMRKAMQPGDEIVAEPPRGAGASLKIRYRLPR
jgi:5-methylcytosine-specific restriction protein A